MQGDVDKLSLNVAPPKQHRAKWCVVGLLVLRIDPYPGGSLSAVSRCLWPEQLDTLALPIDLRTSIPVPLDHGLGTSGEKCLHHLPTGAPPFHE
jgi:hypothetical protein